MAGRTMMRVTVEVGREAIWKIEISRVRDLGGGQAEYSADLFNVEGQNVQSVVLHHQKRDGALALVSCALMGFGAGYHELT